MISAEVTATAPLAVQLKGATTPVVVQRKPSGMSFAVADQVLCEVVDSKLSIVQKVVDA